MSKQRLRFLSFVSHELKNPLSTALWSMDLLARMSPEQRGGERGDRLTTLGLRSLRRMRRLIEDYFSLERMALGVMEFHLEPIDIRLHAVQAADGLRALAKEKGVSLVVDVQSGILQTDSSLLLNVLSALLEREIFRGGGEIRLDGSLARLRLSHAERPIQQVPPEEEPPGDPVGLTLVGAYAKAAVEALGGTLVEKGGALEMAFAPQAEGDARSASTPK